MTSISFVIPLRGRCEWLGETLESIGSQTYPTERLEAIIATDGSSEESVAFARAFLERQGIHVVVVIDANCSPTCARNRGWRLAASDWIQFLDSADLLAPNKLELQAGAIPELPDDADVICSRWQQLGLWNGEWRPFGPVLSPALGDPVGLSLVSSHVGSLGPILVRRRALERVGGFSEDVEFAADEHLILRLGGAGGKFVEAPSPSPLYFIRQTSSQQTRASKIAFARQQLENLLAAEAMLRAQPHQKVTARDREQLAKLRRVRLTALYWQDPAAFDQYAQRLDAPAFVSAHSASGGLSTPPARFAALPAKLVFAAKGLLRAVYGVAHLPLVASRWITICVATTIAWASAKLGSAAKSLPRAAYWVAHLPLVALRWTTTCVAAGASWMWAKLVAAVKRLLRTMHWLALLPVRALRWIATRIGMTFSWLSAKLVVAAKALLRIVYVVARLPMVAFRWMATCIVVGASWTSAKLVFAASSLLQTARWVGHLPVATFRWIAACMTRTTSWTAAKLVYTAKALLQAARWVAQLPVTTYRLIKSGLTTAAGRISDELIRFGRGVFRTASRLWNLPSRFIGLVARPAKRLSPYLAPNASHRGGHELQKAGALFVLCGATAFIAIAALDPLGWAAKKGNQRLDPRLTDAGPSRPKTAALGAGSNRGVLSSVDAVAAKSLPTNRADGLSAIQAPSVTIDAPSATQPERREQQELARVAPAELEAIVSDTEFTTPSREGSSAAATSLQEQDDRFHRIRDSPPTPPADTAAVIAPEMPNAAPGAAPVDIASSAAPREQNDQQPPPTAEPRATVAVGEAPPTTGVPGLAELPSTSAAPIRRLSDPVTVLVEPLEPATATAGSVHVGVAGTQSNTGTDRPVASTPTVAGATLPELSTQPSDQASQPLASEPEAPPASATYASRALPSAQSDPTIERAGQPLTPLGLIVVAIGSDAPPTTVATPPDSRSFQPPAAQGDQMAEPTAPLAANSAVVTPEATPTTASPAADASQILPSPQPGPGSTQAGQPVAPLPLTIVATGSDAPLAITATPPDERSFPSPPTQADHQTHPPRQAMAQPAANVAAVVPPEAPPAISAPSLTDAGVQIDRSSPGPARIPTLSSKERERAERLLARGERDLADGNVAQARQFFLNAAKAGLPRGALLLAATYDPRELARPSVLGVQPNMALARQWYERARELGAMEAEERLRGLVER